MLSVELRRPAEQVLLPKKKRRRLVVLDGNKEQIEFFDFIRTGQKTWKEYKRGVLSRPQEIPQLAGAFDKQVKKTFPEYISKDHPTPIVSWSVLIDSPNNRDEHFESHLRYPTEVVNDEDKKAYIKGISQINEWLTDQASLYMFSHLHRNSIFRKIDKAYALTVVEMGQRFVYSTAYKQMDEIKQYAISHVINFDEVALRAYFLHDFERLNSLISQAGIDNGEVKNLDQLAVFLGKKVSRNSFTEIMNKHLSTKETDSSFNRTVKRLAASCLIGGMSSHPGVIEIVASEPLLLAAVSAFPAASVSMLLAHIATGALNGVIVKELTAGYALVHEGMHSYSFNDKYHGVIPVTTKLK